MDSDLTPSIETYATQAGAITKIISLFISLCLVLSIAHETAFYMFLDSSLFSLLSPTDFLRNAVYWLPLLAISIIWRVKEAINYQKCLDLATEYRESSGDEYYVRKFTKLNRRESTVNGVIFWLLTALFALAFPVINAIFLIILVLLIRSKRMVAFFEKTLPGKWAAAAILVSLFFIFSIGAGLFEASSIDSSISFIPIRTISVKIRNKAEIENLSLIRYIDRGIIGMNDKKLIFVPWSAVDSSAINLMHSISLTEIISNQIERRNKAKIK